MRVEFCGDADKLEPFPEIDFVDFFNTHPKLRSFEAQGAMFAAVANRNSLKQVTANSMSRLYSPTVFLRRFRCLKSFYLQFKFKCRLFHLKISILSKVCDVFCAVDSYNCDSKFGGSVGDNPITSQRRTETRVFRIACEMQSTAPAPPHKTLPDEELRTSRG